jgi:hypothetical protein
VTGVLPPPSAGSGGGMPPQPGRAPSAESEDRRRLRRWRLVARAPCGGKKLEHALTDEVAAPLTGPPRSPSSAEPAPLLSVFLDRLRAAPGPLSAAAGEFRGLSRAASLPEKEILAPQHHRTWRARRTVRPVRPRWSGSSTNPRPINSY